MVEIMQSMSIATSKKSGFPLTISSVNGKLDFFAQ